MNGESGGIIALFTQHRTAANLLLILMVLVGLLGLSRMNTQFFPNFTVDWISIGVEWPGASAEDVDSNIISAIEPEVRFLDNVKRVSSQSSEGIGLIAIEYEQGSDLDSALASVESAVAQVTTLPEDSERPVVTRIYSYETIGRLAVSGPYSEAALRAIAKDMREQLLAAGVDKVELVGARREEIWVEVQPETLRQLDLTLEDISARIAESAVDLPSGTLPGGTEKQIRSLGITKSAEGIGHLEIKALDNGEKIYLREIAVVHEEFNENDAIGLHDGEKAVQLAVLRAAESDALEQAAILDEFYESIGATLPPNIKVEHFDDAAELIIDRINLLLRNGGTGLILVVAVLFIFLSGRVAFWVALGIPASLFATLAAMALMGQSINMVSLFAIIMAIGIIVDDSIVVAEHAVTQRAAGKSPLEAAVTGARRMFAPVMAATLTTVAAFLPLLMVSDIIGQIVRAIPIVIIAVLIASLIECFLVLPGHMRVSLKADPHDESRFSRWFNPKFNAFRDGPFQRAVRACISWRYLTVAASVGLLIFVFGLMAGGRVSFVFFPSPESDTVFANVGFVEGMKRETTIEMIGELNRALFEAEAILTEGEGGVVRMNIAQVGKPVGRSDSFFLGTGDHIGGVRVELIPSDSRTVRTEALIDEWRRQIQPMAGLDVLTVVQQQGGPPGREIDIRVIGEDLGALKAAAADVTDLLARFPGVSDIEDTLPFGKQEAILEVSPHGRSLGFNTVSVAQQVRGAFEGTIAKRFARGDDEVTVRVRFARDLLDEADLRRQSLLSPAGFQVPLSSVVSIREKIGFAQIRREDGKRMVSITAEVDENSTSSEEVLAALRLEGLPEIESRYRVDTEFRGKAEEQATTLDDMQTGTAVGLVSIYLILAWVFSSYSRPLFVMAVIPFGVVAAILGHLILGFDLTILSMVALLGLSGIVVNDSIILVRAIQHRLEAGEEIGEALVGGARDRLRAVILTSVTTIFGLLPLLFETSLQAQFLKPMAVTIVFGLMGSTMIVLILVPVLLMVQRDLNRLFKLRRKAAVVREEV